MTADQHSFLFQYRPKNTCIHRLSAGIKLCFVCSSSFILHISSQTVLVGYAVFIMIAAVCARLSLQTVKRNTIFLCVYTLFIFLIKMIGNDINIAVLQKTAAETVFFMQKMTLILYAASIFYETTSKLELFIFCEKVERFFCRKSASGAPALVFMLMLMCVPRVFETWARLNYAYDARIGTAQTFTKTCRRIVVLLPALIENLIRFAFTAEKALKNRTYNAVHTV